MILRAILLVIICAPLSAWADSNAKTKFYNFDELLIDGKIQRPKVLWTDTRQKAKFEKLLKLRKDLIPRLKATARDPALR